MSLCFFSRLPFLLLVLEEVLECKETPGVCKLLRLMLSWHTSIHELHLSEMQQYPLDESQGQVCLLAELILFLLFLLLVAYRL